MVKVELFRNGPLKQNCYLVSTSRGETIVIDPGSDAPGIFRTLARLSLEPIAIICTHGHFDHIGAVAELQSQFRIPFYLNKGDLDLMRRANLYGLVFKSKELIKIPEECNNLVDGEILEIARMRFTVFSTPGHTSGSICISIGDLLFTGDTIVGAKPGRFDLPGGDQSILENSVRSLVSKVPVEAVCYPGHGEPFEISALKF